MSRDKDGDTNGSPTPSTVTEVEAVFEELGLPHEFETMGADAGYSVFIPLRLLRTRQQLEAFAVAMRRLQRMDGRV